MSNKEILERAISKAIDGGWVHKSAELGFTNYELDPERMIEGDHDTYPYVNQIIFNHDFAKALWGEDPYWTALPGKLGEIRQEVEVPAWKMHLQQMVIAEDPLKYLEKNM